MAEFNGKQVLLAGLKGEKGDQGDGSNLNIIINDNFEINQRGKETYTGVVYGYDRWQGMSANTVVSTATKTISCSTGSWFLRQQRRPTGKTYMARDRRYA